MIGEASTHEPGWLRRVLTRIFKGRHSAYVMVDTERYLPRLPKGAIVKEQLWIDQTVLLIAADMTYAKDVIIFERRNLASKKALDTPPQFAQHGPPGKQ